MHRSRAVTIVVAAALIGSALGFTTGDASQPGGDSPVRGQLELPWLTTNPGPATVKLGTTTTTAANNDFQLPRASDDASGLLSVTDADGRVQGLQVIPQSTDFAIGIRPVTPRSTAAGLLMTAPGVATNDPYIDAITLGAIEQTTALDALVADLTAAAGDDPSWYATHTETLLRQHAGPIIYEAFGAIADAATPTEVGTTTRALPDDGTVLWAAAADEDRNPLTDMLQTDLSVQPQRKSCDSPGMVDKDGLEGDGVCLYALESPPDLANLDLDALADGTATPPSQKFRAVNDTPRWVLVYGGNATVPVALIPPKQWKLGPIEEMLVMVGQTTWGSDNAVSNKLKDFLELIGLEYLRSDDTFREQLELRLRPYNESAVVDFEVTADLLADGLVTVTWWPNDDDRATRTILPEVDGAIISPAVGSSVMQVLTLSTEIVEPVARLAASVGRRLKTPDQRAADKARFEAANNLLLEQDGQQTVNNLCLTGAEQQPIGLGGSLYGTKQSLSSFEALARADGDLARDELECRFRRQMSRRILRALAESIGQQLTDGSFNEQLADGTVDTDDAAAFAYRLLQDITGTVQTLAAEALGGDGLLGAAMTSLLTIQIFPDEIGSTTFGDAASDIGDGVTDEIRTSLLDGVTIVGKDLASTDDTSKPVRQQLDELDGSLDEILLNVVAARVAERAVQLLAQRVGEALIRRFATSFAAVLKVREIANMALDAATILLTIGELLQDSRYLDAADVYGPVMYRSNDDGTVTDILTGLSPGQVSDNGDGTVTISPSPDGIPQLLWQADLPTHVDGAELAMYNDLIGPYDLMVRNDTHGIHAAIDVDGTVVTDDELTLSVTDAGIATLDGRVEATLNLATLLDGRRIVEATAASSYVDVHDLDGALLTVTHEYVFSTFFGAPGVSATILLINDDGTVRWTRQVDHLIAAWIAAGPAGDNRITLAHDGVSNDTFEYLTPEGDLIGAFTGFEFSGRFWRGGPEWATLIGPVDSASVQAHRFNGGRDPVWSANGSRAADCTTPDADLGSTCATTDRWHVEGDYAVAAYRQGGFEVRHADTGSRVLVVDPDGTGDAVTEIAVDGNRLLVGNDDGDVALYDLSTQSGQVTQADAVATLRLGDGTELAPVSALDAYGKDLIAASDALGRIYRYRQTTDATGAIDYRRLWEFPLTGIQDAYAAQDAVYLMSATGTVSAFR
jgi:hypothetical protein